MASTRVMPFALRAAPAATLAFVVGWTILDLAPIADARWSTALFTVLGIGATATVSSIVLRWRGLRSVGLVAIGVAYLGAHAFVLGVELVLALVFLSVLISHIELQVLAERFAPVYETGLAPADRGRINGALGRATLRLAIAGVLCVVVPILAADLALAGIVPTTTIPTAIALAAGLVAVVALLTVMPSFRRRVA